MNAAELIARGLGYAPQEPKESPGDILFPNSKEPRPEPKGRPLTIEETMFYNTNGEKQKLM